MKAQQAQEREHAEQRNAALLAQLREHVRKDVEASVQKEMKRHLSGSLEKAVQEASERTAQTLQAVVAREFRQALGPEVVGTMLKSQLGPGAVKEAFAQSFETDLIPAYQKASQEMFRQMQVALDRGLKEGAIWVLLLVSFFLLASYLFLSI
jgi:hypothetical protein